MTQQQQAAYEFHGAGVYYKTPLLRPVFVTSDASETVKKDKIPLPGPRHLGYAIKVVDAQKTVSDVFRAVVCYMRWDVESAAMWWLTVRITQRGRDEYEVKRSWAGVNSTWSVLFDNPTLDLEHTANWVAGVCAEGTRDPLFAIGRNVEFTTWYCHQIANLPVDHPQSGIVARPFHRTLARQYNDNDYVYSTYAVLPLSDAPVYRRFQVMAGRPQGGSFLDLGCGTGAVGSLIMAGLARTDRWNVYFTDSSPKMVEYTRNAIIGEFGQPPPRECHFYACNALDPQQRDELKQAFGKPNGFDVVIASKFASHFTDASLGPLLTALLGLCAVGGYIVFDLPLPSQYHQVMLNDMDTRLTGGVLEISAQALQEHMNRGKLVITKDEPKLRGPDPKKPNVIGQHFLRDEDLKAGKALVEQTLQSIPSASFGNVTWERSLSDYRDDTASVEAAAEASKITDVAVRP